MPLPDSKIGCMYSVLRFDLLILPPTWRTSFSSINGSRLLILLELCRLTFSPCLILKRLLISSLKYLLWCNLIMVVASSVSLQHSRKMGILDQRYLKNFFPLILSLSLQMYFFTYASVLLILIQQDILSSSVSNILCFSMPIAFTVTFLLTSRSSSFGGWSSALIVHSDSGFQKKAGPLKQRVNLLTFVACKSLEPSSARLFFHEMYFHCFIFEFSPLLSGSC